MTQRNPDPDRPLEDTPEMAAAVADESTVPQLRTGGGTDRDNPDFTSTRDVPGDFPATDEVIGDAGGGGSAGAEHARTGAEQPWEPTDLAVAQGHDPTPEHVERARRELDRDGPAAIEKTVP